MGRKGRQARLSSDLKVVSELLVLEAQTLDRLKVKPRVRDQKIREAAMLRRVNSHGPSKQKK